MSMMRNIIEAREQGVRIDVGFITGQQIRGRVVGVAQAENELSDSATFLLQPSPNDTSFAVALPHVMYLRVVDERNTSLVPSIPSRV